MFAIVGPTHPLAGREDVSLEELSAYPIGCNDFDCDEETVRQLFGHVGTAAAIAADTNEPHILLKMIAAGKCAGICSSLAAVKYMGQSAGPRPLRLAPACSRSVCLVTLAEHTLSPAARRLYRYVEGFCLRSGREVSLRIQAYYAGLA